MVTRQCQKVLMMQHHSPWKNLILSSAKTWNVILHTLREKFHPPCQQGIYFGAVHCTFFWDLWKYLSEALPFISKYLDLAKTYTLKSALGSLILISLLNWKVKMFAGKTYNIIYENGILWQTLPKSQRTWGLSALTKVTSLGHITNSYTNLDQTSSESRPSTNFKISIRD